jgi:catechol 2,3-dioxygenase-like lactoylglutathione lyase family enzyme
MIVGMNHFTVISEDTQKTLDFYVGLLGLQVGHRPDLGFPGAWLYAGGPQAVLHVYFDRPCRRSALASSITWPSRRRTCAR